jgi:hypothetical protein
LTAIEDNIHRKKQEVISRMHRWLVTLAGRFTFRTVVVVYLVSVTLGYIMKQDIDAALAIGAVVCVLLTPLIWFVDYMRRRRRLADLGVFLLDWQATEQPDEQRADEASVTADLQNEDVQRPFKPHEGIEAKWTDGDWYPGEIIRGRDDKYEVRWADWDPSDTSWLSADEIRARPRPVEQLHRHHRDVT